MDDLISKTTAVFSRPFIISGFDEMLPTREYLSGKELSQFLLDEMLADPIVRLVMQADDVSESQLRHLYSGSCKSQYNRDVLDQKAMRQSPRDDLSIQAAENEGMPTWAD